MDKEARRDLFHITINSLDHVSPSDNQRRARRTIYV